MSGITGIFRRDGKDVDPADIKKMNDKIAHRGPDGSRVWCEGPVAFGHQMLHTTQESLHEILPFEDEEFGLVITADARIDNRKDLAPKLGIEDNEYVSDSYFIVKAYEKWGEKCPEELLGDFTFVIWDKNKEQLFCARDHMGVKPFYYYLSKDSFFFASEIKALFTIPEIPLEINELKIAIHLMIIPTDKLYSFYNNIFSLSSSHLLKITNKEYKIKQYWKLDPNLKTIFDSDEEYVNAFREIFKESVNCRLRSAFPIGFELSGGLDSSSVVCVARDILNRKDQSSNNIHTFSLIFDEFPQVDERYYINKIVETGGIEPNFMLGDRVSPLEQVDTILWYQDQPFQTPNMSLHWRNFSSMEKNERRVILGGNGGDQVVSRGNYYLHDLANSHQWKNFFNELRCYSKRTQKSLFSILLYRFVFEFLPRNLKTFLAKISFIPIFNSQDTTLILNKNLIERLGGRDHLKELAGISKENKKSQNRARKHHYYLLNDASHQYVLEIQDRIASGFSIEVRHPFFDKRLVEFCYSIPNEMKFRLGWDRYILRMAMENILPPEVQWRPLKKYFTPILKRNLLLLEKNNLEKNLFNENYKIKEYVDLDFLKQIFEKNELNQGNYSATLWHVLILSLWLNKIHYQLSS